MQVQYLASIITGLFTMAENNPDCTFGELVHSFTRGKNLVNLTDEEVYNAQEKIVNTKLKEDTQLTDEEFNSWVNTK